MRDMVITDIEMNKDDEIKDVEMKCQEEREWRICCSNSSISCVKYFSQLGAIGFSIVFSSVMIALFPHDLEIRSTFMPILTSMIMLLVQPPEHD